MSLRRWKIAFAQWSIISSIKSSEIILIFSIEMRMVLHVREPVFGQSIPYTFLCSVLVKCLPPHACPT